jgi:hypothetical protein
MMIQKHCMASVSQFAEQVLPVPPQVQTTEAELFANDPLLSAIGLGKELWADEHADEYVANLRKDWWRRDSSGTPTTKSTYDHDGNRHPGTRPRTSAARP